MKRLIIFGIVVALVIVMSAPALLLAKKGGGDGNGGNGNKKIKICHVPPGNPDNAHIIRVGKNAAARHLANHDGDFVIENAVDREYCDDHNGNGGNGGDDGEDRP